MSQLPSVIGVPNEMKLGEIDFSLPQDARSYQVRLQPSNISSVSSGALSLSTIGANGFSSFSFPSTTLFFDLPCGTSPSLFLDNRFTTLSFRLNISCSQAGATGTSTSAFLRSGAYSFFDRMYITGQNGNIIEDISEYGLTNDLLCNLQLDSASRDTLATLYGFNSASDSNTCQGHAISGLVCSASSPATSLNQSFSYSIPVLSSLIGVGADKFLNIGKTNKLQLAITTATELPITMAVGTQFTAGVISVVIDNFSLNLEMVDIGASAYSMLNATYPDNKTYIHGQTYKTSAVSMPATSGNQSLLVGVRGSSIKSLFARFVDGGAINATNSVNSKYDSKNPMINNINWSVGGQKYPNNPINPLLQPAMAMNSLQKAIGSFNNSQFQSAIIPAQYAKLSAGGTSQALTHGNTQDWNYNLGSATNGLCQFFYGENLEVIARRGLMSGLNCNSSSVFLEMNIATAPTNPHNVYITGMLDCVYIHDLNTGDIQVRL